MFRAAVNAFEADGGQMRVMSESCQPLSCTTSYVFNIYEYLFHSRRRDEDIGE